MRHVRAALARIAGMFTKHREDASLREELEAHVAMHAAEYVRRGMDPSAARRQALLESGGLTQAAEATRAQRGLPWLESLVADIKYGFRALSHNPVFTAVVVVTLALGIGANTAIFSVVRGVLLKPLPHRDGDRLVYLRHSMDGLKGDELTFSVPEIRDIRNGAKSFAGIAEYSLYGVIHQASEGALRWKVGLVTGNYFDVMGLSPVLGRLTLPSDDGASAAPVAVLTYENWVNRFGRDSSVVGKPLKLDGRAVTVIGVLQPAPFFPDRVEALLNMVNSSHHVSASMVEGRTHRMTQVVGRLTPTANLDQARTQIDALYSRLQLQYPEAYQSGSHYRVAVIPFRDVLGERARFTLWMLMGAAALVLIIAVANVANLTLMRGVRREHELVVRAALGAGTLRLRRLLLVENMLLAFMGAALGVFVAIGGVRLLTSLAERYSPRAAEITLDMVVLGFTVALSAVVALALSFVGWTPVEGRVAALIAAGTRRLSGSVKKRVLQRGLVVAQVAVSVVLLAGAGLLTRTLTRLSDVDTGLDSEQVLTMDITQPGSSNQRDSTLVLAARQRFADIRREVAALPGVTEVGLGSTLPLRTSGLVFDLKIEGRTLASGEARPRGEERWADANYFKAAGIAVLKGRSFTTTDDPRGNRVTVINKTFADKFFPNEDPIGKRIGWTGEVIRMFYREGGEWRTIVGVVADTRDGALDAAPLPVAFQPQNQARATGGALVIRANNNASSLTAAATRTVRRIAPTALIENVMTIQQFKDRSVSSRRLNAVLISSFGTLALLIAGVGIGGVLAFSVSTRTNEIGIRMSLGADRGMLERMILREGGTLVVIGVAFGLTGAFLAGGVMRGLLFGIEPDDPVSLAGAALVMVVIGILACWIPALRAARVDPAITMRAQ